MEPKRNEESLIDFNDIIRQTLKTLKRTINQDYVNLTRQWR